MGQSTVTWRLPEGPEGAGEDLVRRAGTGEDCEGAFGYRNLWCPRDETRMQVRLKCNRARQCPHCVRYWAHAQGAKAAWRVRVVGKRTDERHPALHATVEVPKIDGLRTALSLKGYNGLLREAWRVLRAVGARGGLLVPHLWRRQDAMKDRSWPQTPVSATWYAPHVHFVGYGKVDAEKRPPGAFVRLIRRTEGDEDVCKLTAYLLDHSGYFPRKHCIRWVGSASYNRCSGVERPPDEWLHFAWPCPMCGESMLVVEVVDYTDFRTVDLILVGRGARG